MINEQSFDLPKERTLKQAVEDIEGGRYKEMRDIYKFLEDEKTGEVFSSSISQVGPDGKEIRTIVLEWDDEAKKPIDGNVRSVIERSVKTNKSEATTAYTTSYYNREGKKYLEFLSVKLGEGQILIYSATKDGEGNVLIESMREKKTYSPSHEIRYAPAGKKVVETIHDGRAVIYKDENDNIVERQEWSGNGSGKERGELLLRKDGQGNDLSRETIYGGNPWSSAILNGGGPELARQHEQFVSEILKRRGRE